MNVMGSASVGPFELSWGAATHPGHHRELNEDSFAVAPGAYVVADGMGGHDAGELASAMVIETFVASMAAGPPAIEELEQLITRVNREIIDRSIADGTRGMGTTAVGCVVVRNGSEHSLVVFNIGDSRCYRLADGVLSQVTVDHSHVQELVAAGEIEAQEARTHPLRNVVTRALGTDELAIADYCVLDADGQIRLVLCSDGLSGELTDDEIASCLDDDADPQAAADALLDAALRGDARDNVTVVVVSVTAVPDLESVLDVDDTQPRGIPVVTTGPRPVLPPPLAIVKRAASDASMASTITDGMKLIDDVPTAPASDPAATEGVDL